MPLILLYTQKSSSEVHMEHLGITDRQWKDNLRNQLEDWEEVEELLNADKKAADCF